MLRTLWGIEGPDEEVKQVQKVVIKAFRNKQPGDSRGSNDPPPRQPEEQEAPREELSSSTSSQSTEEKLNTTIAKLNSREAAVRLEYNERSQAGGNPPNGFYELLL